MFEDDRLAINGKHQSSPFFNLCNSSSTNSWRKLPVRNISAPSLALKVCILSEGTCASCDPLWWRISSIIAFSFGMVFFRHIAPAHFVQSILPFGVSHSIRRSPPQTTPVKSEAQSRGFARLVARYDEHDPKNFGKILRAGISSAMMKCLET